MGLIRTKTYIKYARINLQEAEAALQESDYGLCARKVLYCTDALIKAIAAALPTVKKDFFSLSESQFVGYLSDLTSNDDMPSAITADIFSARRLALSEDLDRLTLEAALSHAGNAFSNLHELFACAMP